MGKEDQETSLDRPRDQPARLKVRDREEKGAGRGGALGGGGWR